MLDDKSLLRWIDDVWEQVLVNGVPWPVLSEDTGQQLDSGFDNVGGADAWTHIHMEAASEFTSMMLMASGDADGTFFAGANTCHPIVHM